MKKENTELVRKRVLRLIDSEFRSDAAFERAAALPEKTVNNWRRGRSASFMRLLPELADIFGVGFSSLLGASEIGVPQGGDSRLTELHTRLLSFDDGERDEILGKIEEILAAYSEKRDTGRG